MDNVEKNIEVERPIWGLKKVICLNYSEKEEKELKELEKIKEERKKKEEINERKIKKKNIFANYQKKFGNSMVVKIEFSLQTIFILLCTIINNLADGRVLSKSLSIEEFNNTLGREPDESLSNKEKKRFFQIFFKDPINPYRPVHIVNISSGDSHVLALDYDRNVWAWGSNQFNQINPYIDRTEFLFPIKLEYKVMKSY